MILIVDDKQENIYSLKMLLQLHAYEVDTALNGEEALKKILKNEYDLVILDVQMPGMDGYEVAETLNGYSKTKNTPVIFLSAVNIDKKFITRGYASGGMDYLVKPFDPDLLLLKVKSFCGLSAKTRELKQIQESLRKEVAVRKAAEKALQEANARLEEKVEERTRELLLINKALEQSNSDLLQFASIASHDLQEPLRKIMVFSQIMQDRYLKDNEPALNYVNKIHASSERMRNLINDLLTYSKLSDTPLFTSTDLSLILTETLNDLELSIEEKNAEVIAGNLPVIEAIPAQMRQVFQNLVGNALKFTAPDKKPIIKVWSETFSAIQMETELSPGPAYVRIFIEDNGIGFNEVFLHKIFNIFQRLHSAAEYAGNGIGLAIAKKVIEKHNGSLSANSTEGTGATFVIELPLRQPVVSVSNHLKMVN